MISDKIRLAVCLVVVGCGVRVLLPLRRLVRNRNNQRVQWRNARMTQISKRSFISSWQRIAIPMKGRCRLRFNRWSRACGKRLRFKRYSLAASFLNRVKHNGRLEMTWVGGPLLAPAAIADGQPQL